MCDMARWSALELPRFRGTSRCPPKWGDSSLETRHIGTSGAAGTRRYALADARASQGISRPLGGDPRSRPARGCSRGVRTPVRVLVTVGRLGQACGRRSGGVAEALEDRSGDELAPPRQWNDWQQARSDEVVGLRARDAEELGDLANGVGESFHEKASLGRCRRQSLVM